MEGVKLETGMWWWPQAGHADTWLPHDPPQTATSLLSSNEREQIENIYHDRPGVSDWKPCERSVVHVKSRNGKRIKFGLQNHFRTKEKYWKSEWWNFKICQYIGLHGFQERSGLQWQQNICTFLIDSTAACALQRQHKTLFIRNDHNDHSRLEWGQGEW